MPEIFRTYAQHDDTKAVYVDLGYWGRREGGRFAGYHKIAINSRHPLPFLMRHPLPHDRFARFGLKLEEPRPPGRHILLAGMGDKGAMAEGYRPEQWERSAIAKLRAFTDLPIVYRPKPSWKTARPIEGTTFSPRSVDVADELENCYAVVTHHSNVAVEAVLAGIPVYCEAGVARCFSVGKLEELVDPWRFAGFNRTAREQWAANLAYWQWSVAEMYRGDPWRFLRAEGLV